MGFIFQSALVEPMHTRSSIDGTPDLLPERYRRPAMRADIISHIAHPLDERGLILLHLRRDLLFGEERSLRTFARTSEIFEAWQVWACTDVDIEHSRLASLVLSAVEVPTPVRILLLR